MSDHTERKPLLHEGPLRLLAKNLMYSVKQKDAEIARLKGEMAEAIRLLQAEHEICELPHPNTEAFLQKHTSPLNCGSDAAGESPSHSGGGVKCEPDCRMCSGEYCKIHLNKPCDCDCLDRHGIFQDQKQQKPGGAS